MQRTFETHHGFLTLLWRSRYLSVALNKSNPIRHGYWIWKCHHRAEGMTDILRFLLRFILIGSIVLYHLSQCRVHHTNVRPFSSHKILLTRHSYVQNNQTKTKTRVKRQVKATNGAKGSNAPKAVKASKTTASAKRAGLASKSTRKVASTRKTTKT